MKGITMDEGRDLALLGGTPLFPRPILVGAPILGDQECLLRYTRDILERRWLSNNGVYVQELEQRIATRLGVKHCMVVSNGTLGLQLTMLALGLQGEVIVPSFTFIATPNAVLLSGGSPVFCDISGHDHNLDPDAVERLIGPQTQAIVGVHMWGSPCQTKRLAEIAERHGLALLYDASHAFDCSSQGKAIGHFGRAEVFSFHATKIFNTGEGGAVVTNDDELAGKVRRLRNFGRSTDGDVVEVGLNAKMSEFAAALGLVNLESLDSAIAQSKAVYHVYRESIAGIRGLELYRFDEEEKCNYHFVPLRVTEEYGLSRDVLMRLLQAENIMVQRYFSPGCHRTAPYRERCGQDYVLAATDKLVNEILILPTFPGLTADEARVVADLLRFIQERAVAL